MPGVCPRCSKNVYFAEEKNALGKVWHKTCFLCTNCNRSLDSTNFADHDDEMYCKSCHGKMFGPKGYGYGQGAGVLSMDTGDAYEHGPTTRNIPSTAQAYIAPKIGPSNPVIGTGKYGRTDVCPRCGKAVYMAEKMMGGGSAWHKTTCFTCAACNKRLESTTLTEREGEIYCKGCYGKNFGPRGYGHISGAGSLLTS